MHDRYYHQIIIVAETAQRPWRWFDLWKGDRNNYMKKICYNWFCILDVVAYPGSHNFFKLDWIDRTKYALSPACPMAKNLTVWSRGVIGLAAWRRNKKGSAYIFLFDLLLVNSNIVLSCMLMTRMLSPRRLSLIIYW